LSTKSTQRLGKWNSVTKCFFYCFHIDVSQLVIDLKQQQLKTITILIVKYMKLGCADLPFPLWTCSRCVHCKTKNFADFIKKKCRAFLKFSTKNLVFFSTKNFDGVHKSSLGSREILQKFGSDMFSSFDVY